MHPLPILLLGLVAAIPAAESIVFPPDAGVVDVTAPPYLADPGGEQDATAAIQRALDDHPSGNRIIYLPHGTYLVSETLRWPQGSSDGQREKRTILQGQSRDGTVIRLRDACPGFTDGGQVGSDKFARPEGRPVLFTGTAPAQRFRNAVRDLTVDIGNGNPGAIGVRFNTSNQGGIFSVAIRSSDGAGRIGLDLGYTGEIGPLLVRALRVEGFDIGIHSWGAVNSITLVDVALSGQREVGIRNAEQVLSIENLRSHNAVPAVVNLSGDGVVTLIGAELQAPADAGAEAAIDNGGTIYVRDLRTTGYARAITNSGTDAPGATGPVVAQYVSPAPIPPLFPAADPQPVTSLHLPIEQPPLIPWGSLDGWASPLAYGGRPGDETDDTAAIQRAIDSGAHTVYLPNGRWQLSGELVLRGSLRRLIGCEASIIGESVIRVADGEAPAVIVERLELLPVHQPGVSIHHDSARTLILSNLRMRRHDTSYRASSGAGPLFIEDCAGNAWELAEGQRVWARQLNPESNHPMIINPGAQLWMLGLKTEGDGPALHASGGATEILGAFIYANTRREKNPLFVLEGDARFSVVAGESSFRGFPFHQLVVETRSQEQRVLGRDTLPRRGEGSALPLYRGEPPAP